MSLMCAADERTYMAELVEIGDVHRTWSARDTKARALARASELERARMRGRPIESVEIVRLRNKRLIDHVASLM